MRSRSLFGVKGLRVHIDENLKWNCHIQSVCKRIASALAAIKRMSYLVPLIVLN